MDLIEERDIQSFWNKHPCGESLIAESAAEYATFFDAYDRFRYHLESHIPRCLDAVGFSGQTTLEIGLGQGADSEQIIRRGALWSGLDLTDESIQRVKTRLALKKLPYQDLKQGSALSIPFPDNSFDIVYSHGVLHHIPDIRTAQKEIARVLKPGGKLVIMMYARYSLNYLVSIAMVRRLGLLLMYALGLRPGGIYGVHLKQAREQGLWNYLKLENFIHRNTDGPLNPYAKVYDGAGIRSDFPGFSLVRLHKEFMHAPPLPVHGLPGAGLLGWHLWAHLEKR